MKEHNPKPCPECKSTDLDIDSAQGGSWVQCCDCEFKVQHSCSESAVVKRWNKIDRTDKAIPLAANNSAA